MKKKGLAMLLSVLMLSSAFTVQASPLAITAVGQKGAYVIPAEQKAYPAQSQFYGYNVIYNGQLYADGNDAAEAYRADCRKYDGGRLLNGMLTRVPIGSLINCSDMTDLYGYEAAYHHSFNGNEFCVITRDKLAEAVLLIGVQPVAAELMSGEIKSEYLMNSGTYTTLDMTADGSILY